MRRVGIVGSAMAAAFLLAGCAGPPAQVALDAQAEQTADGWLLRAVATNTGPEPIPYRHGCHQAWHHVLERQGDPVDMGLEACHAFERAELQPGKTHTLRIEWDGREWGPNGTRPAPQAAYVWRVSFLDGDGRVLASDTAAINKGQSVNRDP